MGHHGRNRQTGCIEKILILVHKKISHSLSGNSESPTKMVSYRTGSSTKRGGMRSSRLVLPWKFVVIFMMAIRLPNWGHNGHPREILEFLKMDIGITKNDVSNHTRSLVKKRACMLRGWFDLQNRPAEMWGQSGCISIVVPDVDNIFWHFSSRKSQSTTKIVSRSTWSLAKMGQYALWG